MSHSECEAVAEYKFLFKLKTLYTIDKKWSLVELMQLRVKCTRPDQLYS